MTKDQTNSNNHQSILMRELSDIKAALAVNTNETANIKLNLAELKTDIKDLKLNVADRVSLLEQEKMNKADADKLLEEANKVHEDLQKRIRKLEDWKIWVVAYTSGIAGVLYFILDYFFKK